MILLCVIASLLPLVIQAQEATFTQKINASWQAKNYNEILQLASAEAAKQPSVPEAHAVLFGYHLYIAGNHQQAVQALNQLTTVLESTDPVAFQAVTEYKNEFLQVPNDTMQPPTLQALNELHKLFPNEFPVKILLVVITKQQ